MLSTGSIMTQGQGSWGGSTSAAGQPLGGGCSGVFCSDDSDLPYVDPLSSCSQRKPAGTCSRCRQKAPEMKAVDPFPTKPRK